MKKKNLIVAIVMASMIMGGCGQKTATSVARIRRYRKRRRRRIHWNRKSQQRMRHKAQRNHRKLQTVLQQAAMQRRKVTRRQRVIQHRVAAILPAKEIQQRTTAVRQITIRLHLPGRIHRPYRKVQRIRSLLEFRQNIRCMMEYILTR